MIFVDIEGIFVPVDLRHVLANLRPNLNSILGMNCYRIFISCSILVGAGNCHEERFDRTNHCFIFLFHHQIYSIRMTVFCQIIGCKALGIGFQGHQRICCRNGCNLLLRRLLAQLNLTGHNIVHSRHRINFKLDIGQRTFVLPFTGGFVYIDFPVRCGSYLRQNRQCGAVITDHGLGRGTVTLCVKQIHIPTGLGAADGQNYRQFFAQTCKGNCTIARLQRILI